MQYNKLITGDWHLRRDVPICRNQTEEEWFESQRKTISFIIETANSRDCDIVVLGDTFDTSKVDVSISNMLLQECQKLNKNLWIYFLIGNHEALYHKIDLIEKVSIFPFTRNFWPFASITKNFEGAAHFGKEPKNKNAEEIFLHILTFPSEKDRPPTDKGVTAQELLDMYPKAKRIYTGDFHKNFIVEDKERKVVNPGCINIQKVDYKGYIPKIVYVEDEKIETIELPPDNVEITENAKVKQREEAKSRIGAWLEVIKDKKSMSFDYKNNVLQKMETASELTDGAKNIIRGYLG